MQNKIIVKNCEVRNKYFLITTEKNNRFSFWESNGLEIGKEYAIEWQYSHDGRYKNIKYAGVPDDITPDLEEV